jgi:diguanylate cyclase (GGDEF)-like protein
MTPGKSYRSYLDIFTRVGAVFVASVGLAVICGWVFDIPLLKSVMPGQATMKVNSACAFVAAGVALWLLHTSRQGSQSLRIGRVLSVIVIVVGGLSLSEYVFGLDFGIDQLILSDTAQSANALPPGRMAPATALSFFMVGIALFTLKANNPRFASWPHWLVVPPLFISSLAVVGYAYGVSSLYEVRAYTSMASHTALSFFILSLCILAADLAHGFARIATSDTAGGVVSRRLLPTIPLILFALGWVRLAGQDAGLYDTRFGTALMVLLSITVCTVAVASTGITLDKIDITRRRAEGEVANLTAGLERRVRQRTHQLAEVSAELTAANASLEQLSLHDGLTSLANRRYFDKYLADQIAIVRRHKRSLALVLCDVDAFKAYNDHYGHPAGDECLKQVAAAILSCCRRPADMAARYGGEEFAMILPDTELIGAARIAEAARDAVAQLRIPHERSPAAPYVTISGGVAVLLPNIDSTAQQLISAADESLFLAKRLGRNRMVSGQTEPALKHA